MKIIKIIFLYFIEIAHTDDFPSMGTQLVRDNKSPVVDTQPKSVELISMPLAHVFNMSLQGGIVPLEWKEANISFLYSKKVQETRP